MGWFFALGVLGLLVYSSAFRKIALALAGLGVVIGGVYWAWTTFENRPQVVTELDGVRLGMSPVEVTLAKGAPSTEGATSKEQDGQLRRDWTFATSYGPTLTVTFYGQTENALAASIICEAESYSGPFGLVHLSSEEDVIDKLGQPSRTSIAEDGLSKFVSFSRYKVAYQITKGVVTQVCILRSDSVSYTREYKSPDVNNVTANEQPAD